MISSKGIQEREALSCVGDGWACLIDRFYTEIAKSDVSVCVLQVKEKFGGLRIYWEAEGKDIDYSKKKLRDIRDFIDKLSEESRNICESCGRGGKIHMHKSWLKVSCDDCYREWIET